MGERVGPRPTRGPTRRDDDQREDRHAESHVAVRRCRSSRLHHGRARKPPDADCPRAPRGLDGGMDELVRRGYATASTDTGHRSSEQAWAVGHPEKAIDYLFRAKHLVTIAAKGLITVYYGKPPSRSYFNSCSNGGRQGLME